MPRSVNALMKTMQEPAKSPGLASGNVIVMKRRQADAPRLAAASVSDGSIFASAALTLRKKMGKRCRTSKTMIPVKPLAPSQSIGCASEMTPNLARIRFTMPNRAKMCLMPNAPTNGGRINGAKQRGPEQFAAREAEPGEKNRKRDGDERGEAGGQDRDLKAVDERETIKPVFDEKPEETQRESLGAPAHR